MAKVGRKMRGVSVIGVGTTRYGKLEDKTLRDLIAEAGYASLKDAGIKKEKIEAFYLGNFASSNFTGQNHLAPYGASAIGLKGIPCIHVEAACASGGVALREGFIAIGAGLYDVVMVIGAEKMTHVVTSQTTTILAEAGDAKAEVMVGATFPSLFGLIATRHMYQYNTTRRQLSLVAVKNHANAMKNPCAHMHKEITLEEAMNCETMVADPLNLYDCSMISDGAAAVILCVAEIAKDYQRKPVDIIGSGQASTYFALHENDDITSFSATIQAARVAYRMAGVKPCEIDVAEVHDCFTIAEIIDIEDLGFVEKGEGGPATEEGLTSLEGRIPINPSGGLKAKGHPVGATGIGQVVEIVEQLRGEEGERQVRGAEIGLAQNMGGSGATSVVHIFRKR